MRREDVGDQPCINVHVAQPDISTVTQHTKGPAASTASWGVGQKHPEATKQQEAHALTRHAASGAVGHAVTARGRQSTESRIEVR